MTLSNHLKWINSKTAENFGMNDNIWISTLSRNNLGYIVCRISSKEWVFRGKSNAFELLGYRIVFGLIALSVEISLVLLHVTLSATGTHSLYQRNHLFVLETYVEQSTYTLTTQNIYLPRNSRTFGSIFLQCTTKIIAILVLFA